MVDKRRISMLGIWIGVMIAAFGWMGCAAKTQVCSIRPAEVSMGGIRTLAVLRFDGQFGETVRSDFYSKLAEVQHFNLIDTTQINALDAVIYDQVDDPRFLPMLEDLKADGVITGRVTAEINDIEGSDQVSMQEGTGQYKKEEIFGIPMDVEIKRTVLKPVPYVIRQASLTTHFKVFDLRTKRIISSDKVTKNIKEKFGGDKEYSVLFGKKKSALPAKNETLNDLSSQAAAALVAKISPTKIVKEVKFDSGGGIGGNKMVKQGIEFAKRGDWEEAACVWKAVLDVEPNNAPALYNLGLSHENIGDLKNLHNGLEYYKKAYENQKNTLYIDAIARVKKAIKDRTKYEQQKQLLMETPVQQKQEPVGVRIY